MRHSSSSIRKIARDVFHYQSLRSGQEEAIAALLAGRDTLAVMPTGHGKSGIYQIAALMLDGPTVVVSPLIALQKDQTEFLNEQTGAGAAAVNSLIPERAQEEAMAEAGQGRTEFLFLSPEQLANEDRLRAVKELQPSLFVVDEAHCISEWGHSFRPDYLGLGSVIEALGHPTVLALTATANEVVRAEIVSRLGMRNPKTLVHGFDRPNIWLGVETAAGEDKKHALLLERVRSATPPGIIYTSTRKHAEQINDELNSMGIESAFYHGGLKRSDRESMQDRFMNDQVQVIVATSAFGMGVDKPNVRFVFHYDAPGSLDAYYQEIGRAGRDGEAASAVLFFCPKDLGLHKFFKAGEKIRESDINAVVDALAAESGLTQTSLADKTGVAKSKIKRVLQSLQDLSLIQVRQRGKVYVAGDGARLRENAVKAAEHQVEWAQAEMNRIEQMRMYAEDLNCRRAHLLRYFGEEAPDTCANCDNCQGAGTARAELIAQTREEVRRAPS